MTTPIEVRLEYASKLLMQAQQWAGHGLACALQNDGEKCDCGSVKLRLKINAFLRGNGGTCPECECDLQDIDNGKIVCCACSWPEKSWISKKY